MGKYLTNRTHMLNTIFLQKFVKFCTWAEPYVNSIWGGTPPPLWYNMANSLF